jgi:hypothetical protein
MSLSSETSTSVKQPIADNGFHKFLHKKLRIPRQMVQPFLIAVKIAGGSSQYRLRKQLAEEIIASNKEMLVIPHEDGYRLFGPDDIQGTGEVVSYCTKIYEESKKRFSQEYLQKHPTKKFLLSILEGIEFFQHPELVRFMVSRPLLDAATRYLGTVPRLGGVRLCWSPENETARSSQLFHFDFEDLTQLKVFINIFETKEDQGPFTFLPANVSDQVQKALGGVIGRVKDERIYDAGGKDRELRLVGPSGTGAFVDTSRCLHYGSRFNKRDRLVLIIQYLKIHSSYQPTAPFQVSLSDLPGFTPDRVQKLALGIH